MLFPARLTAVTCSLAFLTAPLVAQETRTQPAPGGVQTAEARSGEQMQNNVLGTCVLIGNHKEIAALKYGMSKTQNAKIKQFCEKAAQDHTGFVQKLRDKAGVEPCVPVREMSMTMNDNSRETGEIRRTSATTDEAPRTTDKGDNNSAWAHRMLKIDQEIAQQCLKSARTELEKKQGAEFDKAFVGMQLGAHMAMKDKLMVFQRHATGELRTLLGQGVQATEQHYNELLNIMKSLESGSTASN